MLGLSIGIGIGSGKTGSTPSQTYTGWNTSALPADVVASNGGFTITRQATGLNDVHPVYHPVTRSTGKYALRFAATSIGSGPTVGFLNGAIGSYGGESAQSAFFWPNNPPPGDMVYRNAVSTPLGDIFPLSTIAELMIEVDFDSGKVWIGVNGVWHNSGNPVAGTGQTIAITPALIYQLALDMYQNVANTITLKIPADFITPASAGFIPGWPD